MTYQALNQKMTSYKSAKPVLIARMLVFIGILFVGLLAGPAYIVQAEDAKSVLFISSYSESFVSVPAQIAGIQSVFDE